MTNLYQAAKALVEKVRKEHPGEELYEPVVINLDKAVNEYEPSVDIATARQQGADAMQEAIAAKFDQEAADALKQVRICRVNDRESRRDAARKLSEAERAAKIARGVAQARPAYKDNARDIND